MVAGKILQFKGPFNTGESLNIPNNKICQIGISIKEKSFMSYNEGETIININGEDIQIGKTFIYLPGDIIENTTISFPLGAPIGTTIDIIYNN